MPELQQFYPEKDSAMRVGRKKEGVRNSFSPSSGSRGQKSKVSLPRGTAEVGQG